LPAESLQRFRRSSRTTGFLELQPSIRSGQFQRPATPAVLHPPAQRNPRTPQQPVGRNRTPRSRHRRRRLPRQLGSLRHDRCHHGDLRNRYRLACILVRLATRSKPAQRRSQRGI